MCYAYRMAHTQTAHELANEFTPRLSKLVRLLARETAGTGMSRTSLSVLATLRDAGTARITELAETEHVAQPSMTTLVSRLEKQELVQRRADPHDGRAVAVVLTRAGRAELERMTAARTELLAHRLQSLTPAERTALAAALPALDRLITEEAH
jgi:DNA-binding MarR family transcriptional regulator